MVAVMLNALVLTTKGPKQSKNDNIYELTTQMMQDYSMPCRIVKFDDIIALHHDRLISIYYTREVFPSDSLPSNVVIVR
jgi:hypothetical protein